MSYGVTPPPSFRAKPMRRWLKWVLISVGVIVLLFVVLIIVGLTTDNSPSGPQAPKYTGLVKLHFGQKATLARGWVSDGIVSATVYSFQTPFTSKTSNRADAGNLYGVSRVQVCAGPNGANTSNELVAYPFEIVFAHNQTMGALSYPDAAEEPDLGRTSPTLHANQCVSGYVTFEYPKGTPPLSVAWGTPEDPNYEWTAAG